MKKLIILALIITFNTIQLNAQDAFSMKSTAQGFSAALHIGLSGFNDDESFDDPLSGLVTGLSVGYGITERIEVFLEYDLSKIQNPDEVEPEFSDIIETSPFKLTQTELGLRLNFGGTIGRLRTFIEGAITYQKFTYDLTFHDPYEYYDYEFTGYGATLGAGVKYHITLPLALKIGGKYTLGTFTELTENDIKFLDDNGENETWEVDFYRLYAGVVYYF